MTSTIKANYEVDQTAGKTYEAYFNNLPLSHNTLEYIGYFPLPFAAKNTSYSVSFRNVVQGNVGTVTPSVLDKCESGVAFSISAGVYSYDKCSLRGSIIITFA